jgi:hypothetical protein
MCGCGSTIEATALANRRSFAISTPASVDALLVRVMGEYQEMPGLSLTASQAQRLWQVDEPMCRCALATLVDRRFLAVTANGTYVRRE